MTAGIFAAALLVAPSARAECSKSEAAKRKKIWDEANVASEEGDWPTAATKLRKLAKIRCSPKPLIALAIAEARLDNLLEARSHFREARREAQEAGRKELVKRANKGLADLSPQIPVLVLNFPPDAHDPTVLVDGRKVTVQDGEVEIDPGPHAIRVETGNRYFEDNVRVQRGERVAVEVVLLEGESTEGDEPPIETEGASTVETPTISSGPPAGAVVLGIVGLATAATGTVVWLNGRSDHNAATAECNPDCPNEDKAKIEAETQDASDRIVLGQVVLGFGAAAIVGAGAWWALSGSGDDAPSTGVTVVPWKSGGFVSVRQRF